MSTPSGVAIKTFVFVDFETDGLFGEKSGISVLPRPIAGQPYDTETHLDCIFRSMLIPHCPHMIELSFVWVQREQMAIAVRKYNEYDTGSDDDYDEIAANVHTRQINPNYEGLKWDRYSRNQRASPATFKLKPKDLMYKADFAHEWPGVRHLLDTISKPACFIAHNGVNFDYPLLIAELMRNGIESGIPADIYYIDTFLMAIDLEHLFHDHINNEIVSLNDTVTNTAISTSPSRSPPHSTLHVTGYTSMTTTPSSSSSCRPMISSSITPSKFTTLFPPTENDQSSLTSTSYRSPTGRPCRKRPNADDTPPHHPLRRVLSDSWSPAKRQRAYSNRHKFQRSNDGTWSYNPDPISYSLCALYKRLIGTDYKAHRSESDCFALMKICIAYGVDFMRYVDENARPFPRYALQT